uniref:Uncharacterized protein n=1 Tax=Salarias fasciatus TaxID=181472 RepID=A0A672GX10_SALFA
MPLHGSTCPLSHSPSVLLLLLIQVKFECYSMNSVPQSVCFHIFHPVFPGCSFSSDCPLEKYDCLYQINGFEVSLRSGKEWHFVHEDTSWECKSGLLSISSSAAHPPLPFLSHLSHIYQMITHF